MPFGPKDAPPTIRLGTAPPKPQPEKVTPIPTTQSAGDAIRGEQTRRHSPDGRYVPRD